MLESVKSSRRAEFCNEASFGSMLVSIVISIYSFCFIKLYPSNLVDFEIFAFGGPMMLIIIGQYFLRKYKLTLFLSVLKEWKSYRLGKGFYIAIVSTLLLSIDSVLHPFFHQPAIQLQDYNAMIFCLSFFLIILGIKFRQKATVQRMQEEFGEK